MSHQLLTLGEVELDRNPTQRRILRGAIAGAIALHVALLALLIWKPHGTPIRVSVAHLGAISAYVNVAPAPAATSGPARPVAKPRPVKLTTAAAAQEPEPVANEAAGAGPATGTGQQAGPVRMTTGQIQLLKKVAPVYPPLMIAVKSSGTVVLDATINPDGSIGEVKVLQSLGDLFDRAAIKAVKQWQYTPPGFEAILTVTVIFSLR